MADSYIVPPVDDSPEALDIFFHQICEQLNPSAELVEGVAPTTDYPDDVTGLSATGGYGNTRIIFDPITYNGHQYTLIVRAVDGNINNAIAVGSTATDVFIDDITEPEAGTTYTYWAKNVNVYGIESTNWSSPATTQLQIDVDYAVDVLAGKLGYAEFDSASGVYPVRTEDVLPTLPDALYPNNSVILLTTNQKLYVNRSGSWVYKVEAGDIENNAVTADAITANAIVAGKIAAGALVVDDGVMQNGYIKTALIDNATITSAKIGSLEVKSANIDNLAVTSAKINDLAANKITAGTIDVAVALNAATITGGLIQTTDGKLTIQSNTLTVKDASNNVRVKLGLL